MIDGEAGRSEPGPHRLVLEAEADVGVACPQLLALMRREIDDEQSPAVSEHPRRLRDRDRGRVGVVQHLVDDDAVRRLVGERQRVHVALAQARGDPCRFELHPGEAQHLRRPVDSNRLARARAEQFDHPAGARPDVEQAAEGPTAEQPVDRALDLAFGDVERADLVPHLGMAGEIAVRGFGAVGPDGFGARGVGRKQRLGRRVGPAVDQREHRLDAVGFGQRQEDPAAFLAALEGAGVGEDLEVPRNPRLALSQHLRQFADRQLHQAQQREDAQPGGIGQGLESVGERELGSHGIRI